MIVLSAAEPMKETSDLAQFSDEKRQDIARRYPGSTQVWMDSGHAMPLAKPEAVVQAVRTVLVGAKVDR